jgi:hypothetical protein
MEIHPREFRARVPSRVESCFVKLSNILTVQVSMCVLKEVLVSLQYVRKVIIIINIIIIMSLFKSRDSAVGIATSYGLGDRGVGV